MQIIRGGVAFAVIAALSAAARAEQAPAPGELEEIVVTAQLREATLQDVPFSIAAQTSEQIRASGATNIVELARNVAGLTITDLGPGQSQVAIRGISAGQVIRDQPGVQPQVGVYLDDSPISVALFTPDLVLFDVDRFEVLRGPQGTLFGSGSEAGTLRYITKQPRLGEVEGAVELGLMNLTGGDTGGNVKGAVNVPLGDRAALRAVGYYDKLPGFVDAYGPNRTLAKNVNDGERTGGRLSVLIKPNDAVSITPRFVYQKLKTNGYPRTDVYNILGNPFTTTEPAVPLGDRTQYRQFREGIDDDFRLADLKLEFDLGGVNLASITSYTDRKVTVLRDASQLTGSVTFQFGGTSADVRTNSPLFDRTKLKNLSQEIRISSKADAKVQWLAGAYYEDLKKDYGQDLPTPGYDAIIQRLLGLANSSALTGAPPNTPFFSDLSYQQKQYAVFGEATFPLAEKWSGTLGGRWAKFTQDRDLYFGGLFSEPTRTASNPSGIVPGSADSSGFYPRAILTFAANDDAKINLQASRGFRLGGINDPLNAPLCTPADLRSYGGRPTWDDEKAWNYELGGKFRFADRRVQLNVAAFYTDIQGLQVPVDAGSCSSRVVFNVPKASSVGVEAELFARANDNWDFGLSATYANAKLKSSVTDSSGAVIAGLADGARLPTAPKFQAVASAGFTLPAAVSGWDFFSNAVAQYVGDSYTQISDQVAGFGTVPASAFFRFGNPTITSFTFDPKLPSYTIVNLRAGVRNDAGWELAAYVNNLTDESAYLSVDRERGRRARVAFLTNPPRTYGVSVRKQF